MKKTIFTYSRKRPTTTLTLSQNQQQQRQNEENNETLFNSSNSGSQVKRSKLAIEEWENLHALEANVTIRRPGSSHSSNTSTAHSHLPSTPQTRRHYEAIRETMAKADRKLGFLSTLSSSITAPAASHHYKKLFRLTPGEREAVGIPDLLAVLRQQEGVLGFQEWLDAKGEADVVKIGEATFSEVFCFDGNEVVKIIPLQLEKPINEGT